MKKRAASQAVMHQSQQAVSWQGRPHLSSLTTVTTATEEEEDSDEEAELRLQQEFFPGTDSQTEEFAEHCESILVCTGVFSSDCDYVTIRGTRPSNHNHRDFVIDHELKQPKFVTHNVLEAVELAIERESQAS